jgi:hypothetical protein
VSARRGSRRQGDIYGAVTAMILGGQIVVLMPPSTGMTAPLT